MNIPYKPRDIAAAVQTALEQMPVVVLTGMRQTGKSTTLTNDPLLAGRHYLNLDDFNTLEALKDDPESFLTKRDKVSIDEVQRLPDLFLLIKKLVDQDRGPGAFLLSGSANLGLLRGITESLAGRAVYHELLPMTRREIKGSTKRKPFLVRFLGKPGFSSANAVEPIRDSEVETGGMPPVALDLVGDRDMWFRGYEQTYLERDLRDISRVENVMGFRRLLRLAAHRTAQVLNISELARDASLPVKTAYRYLGWMETSFILRRLYPYLGNRASRLIKSPKLLFTDSGLSNYLCGGRGLAGSSMKGAMYENYVAQNLLGIMEAYMPRASLHFWQIHGSYEVDFVIENVDEAVAIEVKSGARWSKKDLAGLRQFLEITPNCTAAVLAFNGTEPAQLDEKLWAIPLGLLLS
jgi:predicted AAA+ superfamily ATPase